LNAIRYNHPAGDFLAERDGKRYFITVKARNKYVQGTGQLNSGYNIFPRKVQTAAKQYHAIPAWITIQLDTDKQCYSAYFGIIESLRNPNSVSVPMSRDAVANYECLAGNEFDPAITPDLSNQIADRSLPETLRIGASESTFGHARKGLRDPKPPRLSSVDSSRSTAMVSFDDHVAYADPLIRPALRALRTRITELDHSVHGIEEKPTQYQRIAYSVVRIFAEIKVQKKLILIRFFGRGVADPKNIVTHIPATHRWSHDRQIAIDRLDQVDYAMKFVRASYDSSVARATV
jgi:predicted transport protein